ncbi:MAG: class I SAM-dependent methyltransferase [Planctomycetes bacterium]|nr:class I SAM-dependent methyltransferase [Planctomycetota bacterium]
MNIEEYEKMFGVEDHHWWFVGKRRFVKVLLGRSVLPKDPQILDVGCGTGGMHLVLSKFGKVTGVDASEVALGFARRRSLAELRRAALPDLPFADSSFDVITLFDVLYHRNVGDDATAIREAARVLKPGGLVVITDSALRWLSGPHDVAMHGARRYSAQDLRRLLQGAGLSVERTTYLNFFLFPIAAAWRVLQRSFGGHPVGRSDVSEPSALANALLGVLYRIEAWILSFVRLPWGTTVAAIGRKPGQQPLA